MSESNIDVVRRMVAAFNEGDPDAWLALIHPDVVVEDLNGPPDAAGAYHGHDGAKKMADLWTQTFEDFRVEVSEYVAVADYVVAVVRWHGIARGSGMPIDWKGADLYLVRDGQIVFFQSGHPSKEAAVAAAEAGVVPARG